MSDAKLNLIMGARNGAKTERDEHDFYATDPKALEIFLDKFYEDGEKLSKRVWECCCGLGHLSEVLWSRGHDVVSTDLVNRGYLKQSDCCDLTNAKIRWGDDVLTNPPFGIANELILRLLNGVDNGCKVVMFLKVQFLEGIKRYEKLFKDNPPKYVYVNTARQETARQGEFDKYGKSANTQCLCWFVWQKGFKCEPILRWI